jgi:hypothetical protein
LDYLPQLAYSLKDFTLIYTQMVSITTFTLTFFVNQSYQIWRTCLSTCRTLQGRLNDLVMALAGFATRVDVVVVPPTLSSPSQPGTSPRGGGGGGVGMGGVSSTSAAAAAAAAPAPAPASMFTPGSRNVLVVVARYIRLFNILSFASLTRSHRPLLTPRGMRRLVSRGLLTSREREILTKANIPATQRHNAVLMWILRAVIDGRKAGHIDGGFGFEQQIMAKTQEIRAQGNSIESVLKGRMPFAYAHIVQILVDGILWTYPINAYASHMDWPLALVGSAILTTGYQGLFDLAKHFLDPFYNENFWTGDDPLIVDTLIAETNAGSVRWMYALDEMPISYTTMTMGSLDEFILPDTGFTKEQAELLDEERRVVEEEQEKRREAALSVQELETKRVEAMETVDEELKETRRILETPPGYDVVVPVVPAAGSASGEEDVNNNINNNINVNTDATSMTDGGGTR